MPHLSTPTIKSLLNAPAVAERKIFLMARLLPVNKIVKNVAIDGSPGEYAVKKGAA